MKKILLTLSIIVSGTLYNVKSQIKIINSPQYTVVGKIENFGITKKLQLYQISYQDINTANLNTYRIIRFENKDNDFNNLKDMILQGLEVIPDQDIVLEFPYDIVHLHFEKNYGKATVQFIHIINKNRKYIGKSNLLTKEEILKVFGTKKVNGQ